MAVDTPSMFAQVIQDHLELKRRNAALEHEMPLERYMSDDPFENHPLFKTEEQARVEDTMDGVQSIVDEPTSLDWPTAEDTFVDAPAIRRRVEVTSRGRRASRRSSRTRTSGRGRATSTGATRRGTAAPRAPLQARARSAHVRQPAASDALRTVRALSFRRLPVSAPCEGWG